MFKINFSEAEKLQQALENFEGNAEQTINDVLHSPEVFEDAEQAIKRLMPVSGKSWRGKKPAAKTAKSLRGVNENLSLTVTTNKSWQYLYFPDDGSNTRRHAGNQRFFERGGEATTGDIVERCINKLIEII